MLLINLGTSDTNVWLFHDVTSHSLHFFRKLVYFIFIQWTKHPVNQIKFFVTNRNLFSAFNPSWVLGAVGGHCATPGDHDGEPAAYHTTADQLVIGCYWILLVFFITAVEKLQIWGVNEDFLFNSDHEGLILRFSISPSSEPVEQKHCEVSEDWDRLSPAWTPERPGLTWTDRWTIRDEHRRFRTKTL